MSGSRPAACGESEAWGAEMALGLLSGPERATGLSHLAACPSCREQVDDLARVADRLLLLAPEAEPPAGFESRVLAAVAPVLGSTSSGNHAWRYREPGGVAAGGGVPVRGPRSRRIRLVGVVAAMVVTAAVGGGIVGSVLRSPSVGEVTPLRTGLAVSASGRTSCRVVVTGTRPASLLVSLDGYPGADTDVSVVMETATAETIPLGPLHITGGHGLLVTTLDLDASSLTVMRMLDRDGRVIYEAVLHDHHTLTSE